jgi:hypothetical protein
MRLVITRGSGDPAPAPVPECWGRVDCAGLAPCLRLSTSESNPADPRARDQLARARRDPRLSHGRDVVVADWWAAMEAAERVRRLADWGLQELLDSETHERQRLDSLDAVDPSMRERSMRAARQRAELARAERDNQMIELNAMTLVAMVSAIDALAESLVPRARELLIEYRARSIMEQAAQRAPDAVERLAPEVLDEIRETLMRLRRERAPELNAVPRGAGAKRWEEVLRQARLDAPSDRPIPSDLDEALAEVVALRHVLVHRAGRVDSRALKRASSLPHGDGELVRISRNDYRRYSAALWTYGEEVIRRLGFHSADGPSLADWASNYTINS